MTTVSLQNPLPAASVCPQCGAGLRCGAASGDASCWCFDLPRVVAVPSADPTQPASCLCPACLGQMIARQTDPHEPKDLPATGH